jgi:hypothetical protein
MRTLAIVISLLISPIFAASPQEASYSRSDQIAAAFSKHKDVRKKYKDVRTAPAVRGDVTDYSGRYESDWGWIDIQVGSDGRIQATGYEEGLESRGFELRNATIAGALLTATKVYRDGAAERFEGVFMHRTERASPTDGGITTFGLGVVLASPLEVPGMTLDKLFYQLEP